MTTTTAADAINELVEAAKDLTSVTLDELRKQPKSVFYLIKQLAGAVAKFEGK